MHQSAQVMSSRLSLRSNKASPEAEGKDKELIMSVNQDPQPRAEPILLSRSWKRPPGSHLKDELTDILWLEPLMGPPRKKGRWAKATCTNGPILQTPLLPPSDSSEEEQKIDVSPESSLLPLFKVVTHYSEGARKICFVNFDRYPGPANGSHLKRREVESNLRPEES